MLGFECQDMLVHRGQRRQTQAVGDLFIARAVAVLFQEAGEEIQEFLLAFGESHGPILGEQKGNVNRYVRVRIGPMLKKLLIAAGLALAAALPSVAWNR